MSSPEIPKLEMYAMQVTYITASLFANSTHRHSREGVRHKEMHNADTLRNNPQKIAL